MKQRFLTWQWRAPLSKAGALLEDPRSTHELRFYGITVGRWGFGVIRQLPKEES